MVIVRKMDKENKIEGSRRVKAAPDFSKLHKQWDTKLQKGKAVNKKPLTEAQPFQLTGKNQLQKTSFIEDDFITNDSEKENFFESNEAQNMHITKPKRATIGVVGRSPAIKKSSIPRPSFCVSRRSPGTKPVRSGITPKKNTLVTQKNVKGQTHSHTKRAENFQGFTVDFKADSDALDSIMNCKGVEQLPNTPAKLSSQFGPSKLRTSNSQKPGRVVPFSRPSACARLKGRQVETNAVDLMPSRESLNAAKQRWSIYSRRESYSSKPSLMEWLRNLAAESKARHLAAKQEEKEREKEERRKMDESETQTFSQRDSFLFRKTLVGYQGDAATKDTENNNNEELNITTTPERKADDEKTPKRPLPTAKDTVSSIKSILKKSAVRKTQIEDAVKKPSAVRSLRLKDIGTPVRSLSQAKKRLPLESPFPNKEQPARSARDDVKASEKSVKWADEQSSKITDVSEEPEEEQVTPPLRRSPIMLRSSTSKSPQVSRVLSTLSTPTRSPAGNHKYFTRSKSKDEEEQRESSASSPHSSPTSRLHQIKYVMPAEQPMERPSQSKSGGQVHVTPMRARVLKKLDLHHDNNDDGSKANKSWAQVLEEELDVCNNRGNISSKQQTPSDVKAVTKKKKKRNIKRISILEEIYGKNIYLKDEDEDEDDDNVNKTVGPSSTMMDSPDWMSKLNDTKTRPVPAIDQKVIGDLMSFNDDDESNNQIELEDSRFLTLIKKSQQEKNDAQKLRKISRDEAPFQSTLLQTPARDEYREKIETLTPVTPVLDTSNIHPVAPCRQFTKARTPYKQAMLDILYRTLAEARKQRKDNDDVLDCTMATNADATFISCEETNEDEDVFAQPLLDGTLVNNDTATSNSNDQPLSWLKVPNLTSPSMRAFPGKQELQRPQPIFGESKSEKPITRFLDELNLRSTSNAANSLFEAAYHPLLNSRNDTTLQEKKPTQPIFSNIPNLHSPSMRLFSSSETSSNQPNHLQTSTTVSSTQSNVLSESLFTSFNKVPNLHSPSMKMFPQQSLKLKTTHEQASTEKNISSFNFSHTGLQSTVTFAPPKHSPATSSSRFLRAPSFTINHRNSPVVSSKVNATSSTSSSSSSFGGFEIKPSSLFTNEAPTFSTPTLFAGLAQHAKFQIDNQSSIALPTEENEYRPKASSETSSQGFASLLRPASFSLNKSKSAFRPVKITSGVGESLDGEEVGLNTEVEVYIKIGEQYGIKHVPRCGDGAFNVVANLLTFGDQQHFIPISP